MVKRLLLTDENLSKMKLHDGESDRTFWDTRGKGIDLVRGFGLRVRVGGSRVFILRYKHDGQTCRVVLGEVGLFKDVEAARAIARTKKNQVLAELGQGVDPRKAEAGRRGAAKRIARQRPKLTSTQGR